MGFCLYIPLHCSTSSFSSNISLPLTLPHSTWSGHPLVNPCWHQFLFLIIIITKRQQLRNDWRSVVSSVGGCCFWIRGGVDISSTFYDIKIWYRMRKEEWEGVFTLIGDKKILIWRIWLAHALPASSSAQPSQASKEVTSHESETLWWTSFFV